MRSWGGRTCLGVAAWAGPAPHAAGACAMAVGLLVWSSESCLDRCAAGLVRMCPLGSTPAAASFNIGIDILCTLYVR